MAPLTRREALGVSAGALFLANPLSALSRRRLPRRSPNEELGVAVVGVKSRGKAHVDGFRRLANVAVRAICDCDRDILAGERERLAKEGVAVDTHVDLRELLDRDDVDVISIATPNHWHALATVWACQAGKDVYVEKPVSHDLAEGARMVRAAREHGRIVQTGSQIRSSRAVREAMQWLHDGHLGPLRLAHGLCFKPRRSIGLVDGPQPVPPAVDYDLWTGPAPMKPLRRTRLHYDWHWDFTTGNGDLGNQGVHQMDLCRWALGTRWPARVRSVGGRFGYRDDADTPNTLLSLFEFEDSVPLLFEVRGLPRDRQAQEEDWEGRMPDHEGVRIGAIVYGEQGKLVIPSYARAAAFDPEGAEIASWEGGGDHFANFVDAVRDRRAEDLTADIEEGHLSAGLCHLANASYRTAVARAPGTTRRLLGDEPVAGEAFDRMTTHLAANGIDPERTWAAIGPRLEFDASSERIRGEPRADALLERAPREPFGWGGGA